MKKYIAPALSIREVKIQGILEWTTTPNPGGYESGEDLARDNGLWEDEED